MNSTIKHLAVKLCPLALLVIFSATSGCQQFDSAAERADFSHDVETEAKPWTHLEFQNNPEEFQFAILSDRTGGHRAGVFPMAIEKLNLLRPEFVLTVGDMIEGMTEEEQLLAEWEEFNSFIAPLKAPFFYLPGNHDNITETMAEVYDRLFGRAYYSFTYRDVLFLCLDTQDEAPSALGEEQLTWAIGEIERHPDVRWTFVILHQPLWVYEEGNVKTARKKAGKGRETGFKKIEEALGDRDYTVFAGHFHQYVQYEREEKNYIILGTTGGGSSLRGTEFGEFDHAVWITMTDDGPVIANLLLDGIHDETVHTEEQLNFDSKLNFDLPDTVDLKKSFEMTLPVHNAFDHVLEAAISWNAPEYWTVKPARTTIRVSPEGTEQATFTLSYTGDDPYPTLPTCRGYFSAGDDFMREIPLDFNLPITDYLASHHPQTQAVRAIKRPTLDGNLTDAVWTRRPDAINFRFQSMATSDIPTEGWLAYDDEFLYLAMRCHEPNMAGLRTQVTQRDGQLWTDDSIEFFIRPKLDEKTYYQFVVNSAGVLFDSKRGDVGYKSATQIGVGKDDNEWVVELAIPWSDLGVESAPTAESLMSLLLVRTRTQSEGGGMQYPPINAGNLTPERFAPLTFAP